GIVTGPDDAVWFVENGVDGSNFNYIGRIDPVTKALDVFQIPTKNANPWGIVKGPDGAIWFTECLTGKIGKLQ
ncbi:MAG: Virginiamycin B lyase, partial [Candidatus Eremiobacteraeota bacterium]|nr:Virginiamycin B lyase [Candidatus Eremiobacteraeota bacterium]